MNYLGNLEKHEKGEAITTATKDIRSFSPSCSRGDRTRYFLKVQDGCDYFCSYCTIPFARGRSRNGRIEDIVAQARRAAGEGGKEIVITGVNIGDFGKTTGETFFDLVKELDKVEGIERYRISSIEPNLLTDEIIEYVSRSRAFMPHFHIPLQSGSDDVLKLMRRRYDTALFASKIRKIKEKMPDAFIGVDVIVGTRGETELYFEDAYRFIEGLEVTQLHVFSYSERPGTQALKIMWFLPRRNIGGASVCWRFRTKRQRLFMPDILAKRLSCLPKNRRRECRCMALRIIISGWNWNMMMRLTISWCA